MLRAVQRLCRNGNSYQITVARPILTWLGWHQGTMIEVIPQSDRSLLVRAVEIVSAAPRQRPVVTDTEEVPVP